MKPTDVLAVRSLATRDGSSELTALNWPKTPPENQSPTTVGLLRDTIFSTPHQPRIGVALDHDEVRALVAIQPRSSGLIWDVQRLITRDGDGFSVELLRWACQETLQHQGRRIFIETPGEGPGFEAASRAGFERCTGGSMFRLRPGVSFETQDAVPARPRLRSDEMGLFQLYNTVVPAPVRAAEALDYEEWKALHRGPKPWAPSLMGAQEYVWEMGPRVVGWMHLVYGERAQYLTALIHPQADALAPRMLLDALGQLSTKVPILADVREYQGVMRDALQAVGFDWDHDYVVWVKQLAQRVLETSLAAVQSQPNVLAQT